MAAAASDSLCSAIVAEQRDEEIMKEKSHHFLQSLAVGMPSYAIRPRRVQVLTLDAKKSDSKSLAPS